jgi:hypothetical protein
LKKRHFSIIFVKNFVNMEAVTADVLLWEEIKTRYPDEWVVLGNPVFEGTKVLKGAVLSHHPDKRVASIEGASDGQVSKPLP